MGSEQGQRTSAIDIAPTRGVTEALTSGRGARPVVQHAIANVSTHLRSSGRAVTGIFVCGMFVGAPSLHFFLLYQCGAVCVWEEDHVGKAVVDAVVQKMRGLLLVQSGQLFHRHVSVKILSHYL